jgi:hypothetical protein
MVTFHGPPPDNHEITVALEELVALPANAHERALAGQKREFIAALRKGWEDARAEGRAEEKANAVLTALRARGIAVPAAVRKRILAEEDLQCLDRWFKKAVVATSLGEVIDDRAEARSSKTGRPAAHKERSGRRSARVPAQR